MRHARLFRFGVTCLGPVVDDLFQQRDTAVKDNAFD
jgi:hypothetical protein